MEAEKKKMNLRCTRKSLGALCCGWLSTIAHQLDLPQTQTLVNMATGYGVETALPSPGHEQHGSYHWHSSATLKS